MQAYTFYIILKKGSGAMKVGGSHNILYKEIDLLNLGFELPQQKILKLINCMATFFSLFRGH